MRQRGPRGREGVKEKEIARSGRFNDRFRLVFVVVLFQPEMKSQNPEPRIRSARTRPSSRSRFIFTDYHTLDDCKLECNSSSASVDLSSVSSPPLSATDSSVLTSVVLPVSADGSLNFFAGQSHGYSQLQFCSLFMSHKPVTRSCYSSLSSVL